MEQKSYITVSNPDLDRLADWVRLEIEAGYLPLGSPAHTEDWGWTQALLLDRTLSERLPDAQPKNQEEQHQLGLLLEKHAPEFTDVGAIHQPDQPVPCPAFSWVEVRPYPLQEGDLWLEMRADGLSWDSRWMWRYTDRPKLVGGEHDPLL